MSGSIYTIKFSLAVSMFFFSKYSNLIMMTALHALHNNTVNQKLDFKGILLFIHYYFVLSAPTLRLSQWKHFLVITIFYYSFKHFHPCHTQKEHRWSLHRTKTQKVQSILVGLLVSIEESLKLYQLLSMLLATGQVKTCVLFPFLSSTPSSHLCPTYSLSLIATTMCQ